MTKLGRISGLALAVLFALAPAGAAAGNGEGHGQGGDSTQTKSPIQHTIILYQENISFDHYFGTYGHGSNGIPAGSALTYSNGSQTCWRKISDSRPLARTWVTRALAKCTASNCSIDTRSIPVT